METLRPTQEQERPISEYSFREILDEIYTSNSEGGGRDLTQDLDNLSFQKEKESETLQQLITSSEKQSSNPRIQKQVHNLKQKLEEIQSSQEVYATSKMAVDVDKVGFLAREYHPSGDPQPEEFNRVHFQIAAQTVLGLSIK